MSAKKIDELFRQKLSGHAVAPGEQAWAKLQKKMKPGSKTPPVWMRVAAAATLLAISGMFLLLRESPKNEPVLTNRTVVEPKSEIVEEPREDTIATPQLPESEPTVAKNTQNASESAEVTKKRAATPVQPQKPMIASAEKKVEVKDEPVALEDLQRKEESIAIELPENPMPEVTETAIAAATEATTAPEVKITYIAGDDEKFLKPVRDLIESEKQKDKKGGFSKLLASARNITSGDILAEIRESKDDLFNGNFKLNKDEKVNNSK